MTKYHRESGGPLTKARWCLSRHRYDQDLLGNAPLCRMQLHKIDCASLVDKRDVKVDLTLQPPH